MLEQACHRLGGGRWSAPDHRTTGYGIIENALAIPGASWANIDAVFGSSAAANLVALTCAALSTFGAQKQLPTSKKIKHPF